MNRMLKRISALAAALLTASSLIIAVGAASDRVEIRLPQDTGTEQTEPQQTSAQGVTNGLITSDRYFDDAVFIGDSISLQLRNFVRGRRENDPSFMGSAEFLTRGGLGSGIAQLPITADSLHPYYQDEKVMIDDAVAEIGAKKAYVMFGMNDIVPYGVEGAVRQLDSLIMKIRAKSPGILIAVQSVTPILVDHQQRNLNNPNILRYNALLKELCETRGYTYLDVGSVFRDENDALYPQYCGDSQGLGMHLSNAACVPWIEYLRSHPLPDAGAVPRQEAALAAATEDKPARETFPEEITEAKEAFPEEITYGENKNDRDATGAKEAFPEEITYGENQPEPETRG